MRKNLQHIQIEKSELKSEVVEENHFLSFEGIQLKSTYSQEDIEGLKHLDFGAGFAPNLRGIHSTMYIQQPWKIHKKTDFTIATVEDMKEWMNQSAANEISVLQAMTPTILPIMAFYAIAAEEQNGETEQLSGIVLNEISSTLKSPQSYQHSLRICTDVLEFTHKSKPNFNPISIAEISIKKAETTVNEPLAHTLIFGLEMVRTGLTRGIKIDDLVSQLSFSFNIGMNHFIEIAKMRAARMIWAKLMQQFEPKETKSLGLRIHSQTVTSNFSSDHLTRMSIEATSAVLGGTQSLQTNSFDDENLSQKYSERIARNTQFFLQNETKITKTVDPWAGSFYVENLTHEIVQKTWEIIAEIENLGGMTQAIASGFVNLEEEEEEEKETKQLQKMDNQKSTPTHQNRDAHKVQLALDTLADATKTGKGNLIEFAIEAAKNGATFDEIVNNSIY